ncbi:MAG: pseudouridine synthase [Vulcanimicrobiota bacterium]
MQVPEIVAQTDHWLVVNKPSGMVVHRSRGANDRYTLVKTMRDQLGPEVYPVNRLDRQTSGVIVMARSREAARELSQAFAQREVKKVYEAVVRGWPPLEPDQEHLIDRELSGKPASTRIHFVCKNLLDLELGKHPQTRVTRLRLFPKTGLTHQIRRHLRGWGYPIVNDQKHGDRPLNRAFHEAFKVKRMLLHSRSITFTFQDREYTAEADWSGRTRGLLHHLGLLPEAETAEVSGG